MIEICFVHTPSCSECQGKMQMKQFNNPASPCYACPEIFERQHVRPGKTFSKIKKQEAVIPREIRDRMIIRLYCKGMSYGQIGIQIGAPRSTVATVVQKYRKVNSIPSESDKNRAINMYRSGIGYTEIAGALGLQADNVQTLIEGYRRDTKKNICLEEKGKRDFRIRQRAAQGEKIRDIAQDEKISMSQIYKIRNT